LQPHDCPADAQKNELKPHLSKYWCIPPHQNGEFVAAMEDVLAVYHRPYDPLRPMVCLDEASKQLVAQTRPSIPPSQAGLSGSILSTAVAAPPACS
jgi:hypothetical protein